MDVGKLVSVAGQRAEFKKNVGKQSLQAFFVIALYQTFARTTKNNLPLSQLAFCTLAIVR